MEKEGKLKKMFQEEIQDSEGIVLTFIIQHGSQQRGLT